MREQIRAHGPHFGGVGIIHIPIHLDENIAPSVGLCSLTDLPDLGWGAVCQSLPGVTGVCGYNQHTVHAFHRLSSIQTAMAGLMAASATASHWRIYSSANDLNKQGQKEHYNGACYKQFNFTPTISITGSAVAKTEAGQCHLYPDEVILIRKILNTAFEEIFQI